MGLGLRLVAVAIIRRGLAGNGVTAVAVVRLRDRLVGGAAVIGLGCAAQAVAGDL